MNPIEFSNRVLAVCKLEQEQGVVSFNIERAMFCFLGVQKSLKSRTSHKIFWSFSKPRNTSSNGRQYSSMRFINTTLLVNFIARWISVLKNFKMNWTFGESPIRWCPCAAGDPTLKCKYRQVFWTIASFLSVQANGAKITVSFVWRERDIIPISCCDIFPPKYLVHVSSLRANFPVFFRLTRRIWPLKILPVDDETIKVNSNVSEASRWRSWHTKRVSRWIWRIAPWGPEYTRFVKGTALFPRLCSLLAAYLLFLFRLLV